MEMERFEINGIRVYANEGEFLNLRAIVEAGLDLSGIEFVGIHLNRNEVEDIILSESAEKGLFIYCSGCCEEFISESVFPLLKKDDYGSCFYDKKHTVESFLFQNYIGIKDGYLFTNDFVHKAYSINKDVVESRIKIMQPIINDYVNDKFGIKYMTTKNLKLLEEVVGNKYRRLYEAKMQVLEKNYMIKMNLLKEKYQEKIRKVLNSSTKRLATILEKFANKYNIYIRDKHLYIQVNIQPNIMIWKGVKYEIPEHLKKYCVEWLYFPIEDVMTCEKINRMYAINHLHPNISSSGEVCLGDLGGNLSWEEFDKIIEILHKVNFDSAYDDDPEFVRNVIEANEGSGKEEWKNTWEV